MDTDGDFRQIIYASNRVCGGPYKPGRAGGRKARHAGGPPVIRLAPPGDHGAALETIHAGGAVHHPPPSRAGALGPGFPGPAAPPACPGPALRGPVPLLGAIYTEGEGAAGGAPAGPGACGTAAADHAAPSQRHSPSPPRTPSSPRDSHAALAPARPVGHTRPPGSGQEG